MIFPEINLKEFGNDKLMVRTLEYIKSRIDTVSPYVCDAVHPYNLEVEEFRIPGKFLVEQIEKATNKAYSVVEWRMKRDEKFYDAVTAEYNDATTFIYNVNYTELALEYRQQWLDHMIKELS